MDEIYKEYGYYVNTQVSFEFSGQSGMEKMKEIMGCLRESTSDNGADNGFSDYEIVAIHDYDSSVSKNLITNTETEINLPCSNVLSFDFKNNANAVIRPSGTEPKIKAYINSKAATREESDIINKKLSEEIYNFFKSFNEK